ncbi:MAG TPA: ribosome maturation factor RimM [Bacillota bacterium]|jgi:16S rRNA processing protein RimM|nr:ribosome maturation factor RimM [Bacillota bacterium]HOL10080.1 ribosome maturation factor RimM [Bacillota bacterium]HPO98744.1 ribosome maturation factor RimM [Bacillota bacterium]
MDTAGMIAVGEILKAQGIKGEVKVVPLTDDPRRFGKLKRLFLQTNDGVQELTVESYRLFRQFVLVKFKGIDDMNAANQIGRGLLLIPREERVKLPPGRYFYDQIEGLSVFTTDGQLLGTVSKILNTGSNDVYVVTDNSREILIPALKTVVKEINLNTGTMVVELPDGLLEE